MWIGVQIQLVEKFMLIEGIAGGRRKSIIKRPAVFQHQWIHDGNRNKRLQTFQFTENERAMRPGAGKGNVQMVTIFSAANPPSPEGLGAPSAVSQLRKADAER